MADWNNNFKSFANYNNNSERNNTMNNRYFDNSLNVSNPAPRCPVVLLLDVSGSMSGEPIRELNQGYRQFLQETMNDEAASMSVDLEVITFGNSVEVRQPFMPVSSVDPAPAALVADGLTPMGEAFKLASAHLKERRQKYRDNGISAYRPWVVLMTDGQPTDKWEQPAAEVRTLAEQGKINYLGIAIGDGVNMNTLGRIVPSPMKLQGLKFRQFFHWLTDSLGAVSASAVSDQDNIQFGDVSTWADLNGFNC